MLARNGLTDVWQKAVLYHLVHAVVMLLVASRSVVPGIVWTLFFVGVLIFSGSLYLLAVTNLRWLGLITPIGGLCLLAGWLLLAIQPM